MAKVRLTGVLLGKDDPRRKERGELLYHLFASGWDIYNGNGDQSINLSNIQQKIIESDAFIFTPTPTLEDYFNLASVFVGFQTLDRDLGGKPTVIINSDNSWDDFLELMDHLHALGTIKERYTQYITVVNSREEAVKILDEKYKLLGTHEKHLAHKEPDFLTEDEKNPVKHSKPMPEFNLCVFCSASIRHQEYLDEGYQLGVDIAKKGWGCISGAGKTGIMGQVVKGAHEGGGWSGGSNVPHIIRLEGLPEGLNEFWPRADIYTRMEIMIDKSAAFIVMPGGMGTVQELLAMLLLKHRKDDLMKDKKIVIFNKHDKDKDKKFWDPMIKIIKSQSSFGDNFAKEFVVVENASDILQKIKD